MAKRVVLKKEARQVGTKLVKINEECSLPDHLAMALEGKGLCVIIEHGVAVEMIETKMPMVPVDTKVAKAAKAKAAKVAKARADGKVVVTSDVAGGNRTTSRSGTKARKAK